jgi:hypothetical protein
MALHFKRVHEGREALKDRKSQISFSHDAPPQDSSYHYN